MGLTGKIERTIIYGVDKALGISTETPDRIYLDLKQASENLFGLRFSNPKPINLGFLNLKWTVETEEGMFVIKQFSRERYERFGLERVFLEQQVALREQLRLYENGTPCPKLLTHNGNIIHISPNDERFVVMKFMSGDNLAPGTLNEEQMYSLGQVTAHMHNTLNDGNIGAEPVTKFVPPSLEQRIEQWNARLAKAQGDEGLVDLISKQITTTEQFDLDSLSLCEPGWAHRDLWVDNILFTGHEVSAILDFDRCAFDYPELDIARAIMSGVLNGNRFNTDAALAFLDGYCTKRKLKKGTLVRSLQLLWYLESVWWIVPHLNRGRYQEVQFENEMVWLGNNLMYLKSMFGDF